MMQRAFFTGSKKRNIIITIKMKVKIFLRDKGVKLIILSADDLFSELDEDRRYEILNINWDNHAFV